MRLANGTGTVTKLSGRRRKPWCAKKFVGWKVDDESRKAVPVYKSIGCYAKKTEAYRALLHAIDHKEDERKPVTLEQVYSEWSAVHYEKISQSTRTVHETAWRHLQFLHSRPIADIRTRDIEDAIEKDDPPRTVRPRCSSLLSLLYRYAIAHDYCDKDYSKLADARGNMKSEIERKVFTPEEIADLFTRQDVISDMILVGCYTGMRPGELIGLKLSEIDGQFFRIHGSKTINGLYRDCPIHMDILSIVERNAAKSAKFAQSRLFVRDNGRPLNYTVYHDAIEGHTPHDTRHSFVTYAKRSGMDDLAVKRIVGHSSNRNVTEDVYTHTDDDFLQREMEKFKIE